LPSIAPDDGTGVDVTVWVMIEPLSVTTCKLVTGVMPEVVGLGVVEGLFVVDAVGALVDYSITVSF